MLKKGERGRVSLSHDLLFLILFVSFFPSRLVSHQFTQMNDVITLFLFIGASLTRSLSSFLKVKYVK